ncbi:MAG: hypothetical protein ACR2FF_04065 [Mycobacteriales bacterium]|nr:MAG: hypothetical protein DLM56_13500 [Pseudonocardiales bacterium]
MTADSDAGAKLFTDYAVGLGRYAYAALDADAFAPVSLPGCTGCRQLMASIRAAKARGHHFAHTDFRVVIDSPPSPQTLIYEGQIVFDGYGPIEVDATGRPVGPLPPGQHGKHGWGITIKWTGEGWAISVLETV